MYSTIIDIIIITAIIITMIIYWKKNPPKKTHPKKKTSAKQIGQEMNELEKALNVIQRRAGKKIKNSLI